MTEVTDKNDLGGQKAQRLCVLLGVSGEKALHRLLGREGQREDNLGCPHGQREAGTWFMGYLIGWKFRESRRKVT